MPNQPDQPKLGHSSATSANRWHCDDCGRDYRGAKQLQRHINTEHAVIRRPEEGAGRRRSDAGRNSKDRRKFGQVRKLPSGRYQARYADPDGRMTPNGEPLRHTAPNTFDSREDAEAWLTDERRLISAGTWTPPKERKAARTKKKLTLAEYAEPWLAHRTTRNGPLKPSTRQLYRKHLDNHILPAFGELPLEAITTADVRRWHAGLAKSGPTLQSHCYALLRTILGTAVDDELIKINPARIRGAGSSKRQHKIRIATSAELDGLAAELPARYSLLVYLGAWCGLRWGELTELRRRGRDLDRGIVHVDRAVTRVDVAPKRYEDVVGDPKSDAGIRTVAIPPHIVPLVTAHLAAHVQPGKDALLFPAATDPTRHLSPGGFRKVWTAATEAVGLDGFHVHDLRHHGATRAAIAGATTAELMRRIGHSTPNMAARYQHALDDRDSEIARKLSEMAGL